MATSSTLVLSTKKEEEQADSVLAAISNIGRPLAQAESMLERRERVSRRSRFFYQPTKSVSQEVEARKSISVPKEVEFIDQQVEERRKTYQQELRPVLDKNLTRVREFWLRDVAPLTLGAQAGSQQAKDVVQRALGVPIDESQFAQFEHMLHKGATLVLARYITRYLKLPSSTVQYLLDSITPKKEVLIVNPMEHERRARKPEPASGNEATE